ncbi:hypothetical protein GW916_14155 [bacterium]|nr:hypothetical protein [bacterium]
MKLSSFLVGLLVSGAVCVGPGIVHAGTVNAHFNGKYEEVVIESVEIVKYGSGYRVVAYTKMSREEGLYFNIGNVEFSYADASAMASDLLLDSSSISCGNYSLDINEMSGPFQCNFTGVRK